jgi:hypothetical protein
MRIGFGWQHLIAAASAIAVVGLAVWSRTPPIDLVNSVVETPMVPPGGMLVVGRKVKWLRSDCTEVFISASLIDTRGFIHPIDAKFLGVPVMTSDTRREWPVPWTMPTGDAIYRAQITFHCPPFFGTWPIVIRLPEIKFMVM